MHDITRSLPALAAQLADLEPHARAAFREYAQLNNQHTSRRHRKLDPYFGADKDTHVSFAAGGVHFDGYSSGYEHSARMPWEWLYDRAAAEAQLLEREAAEQAEDAERRATAEAKERERWLELTAKFDPQLRGLAARLLAGLKAGELNADGDVQITFDAHEAVGLTRTLKELSGDA